VAELKAQRVVELAARMKHLAPAQRTALLAALAQRSPGLVAAIRAAMFTFEDLKRVRPRSMPVLIAAVPRRTLELALRGVEGPVLDAIYAGLSQRAKGDLMTALVAGRPRRKSEVHEAQRDMVEIARRLERDGKIFVDRPGDPDRYV
jgi:flagellar motor switch protein FliG